MAARFGATIVPFGAVGEDDIADVSLCILLLTFFKFLLKSPFDIGNWSSLASSLPCSLDSMISSSYRICDIGTVS